MLIPTNFDILPKQAEYSAKPTLLKKWRGVDLWYKKDDKFERPKCKISMKIYTNDCSFGQTPESRMFAHLWTAILNEHMREFNYMANCANLHLQVTPKFNNISFEWSGFNDTMKKYIGESMKKMGEMKQEDLRNKFNEMKDKLMMDWNNHYFE